MFGHQLSYDRVLHFNGHLFLTFLWLRFRKNVFDITRQGFPQCFIAEAPALPKIKGTSTNVGRNY